MTVSAEGRQGSCDAQRRYHSRAVETETAIAVAPSSRCAVCGHLLHEGGCSRCGGRAAGLLGEPVRPGRAFAPKGFLRGMRTMFRASLQVVLMRDFVGLLWLPMLANAVVVAGCGLAAWLVLLPAWQAFLSSRWFALDQLSGSTIEHDALKLMLVSVWLLLPVLLTITTGVLMEPLHAATEAKLCGPGMRVRPARALADVVVQGLRFPVRALLAALLAAPVLLPLGLVPWVGLPLALLGTGALAGAVLCEPAAARRGLEPREVVRLLRRNWASVLGLGVAFEICVLVPLLDLLLLMPAAAVASAALYFRFDKSAPQG